MNTQDIVNMINKTTSRTQVGAVLDKVEQAIERDECDFNSSEWEYIASQTKAKISGFTAL
jgi:hypothetical protein